MNDHSVAQALGDLQGTVRAMSTQWAAQEETASAGRRALYERFERVSAQLVQNTSKLDGVTQDVAEIKESIDTKVMPTVDAYKADAARKSGVAWAGKLFWSLIVALAGSVGFAVHEMLLYFGHNPIH